MYDRTCHECFEPIPSDFPMVVSPATGRRWHVMCAPPVECDEPRKKPRRMVQSEREDQEDRRDTRAHELLVDSGVFSS